MNQLVTTKQRGHANAGPVPGQAMVAVFPPEKPGGAPVTALVKVTSHGTVRSMLCQVPLSVQKGEVFPMPFFDNTTNSWSTRYSMTAAGYAKVNQFGGVNFATPENIIGEDGEKKGNPYVLRDKFGEAVYVKARRIGVGRNAVGNLVAIDLTVTYDLSLYFAQDVWSKWTGKKKDPAPKQWGELFPDENVPEAVRKNPKRKLVRCPGGFVLALDLTSKEVLSIIQEHINRQKFADRNAITICDRNILKKFYALAIVDKSFTVPVISWQQVDRDLMETAKIIEASREGRVHLGDEEAQVERGAEIVDKDEVDAALAGEVDEDMPFYDEPDGDPGIDSPEAPDPAGEKLAALRTKIRDAITSLPLDRVAAVLKSVGLANVGAISTCTSYDTLANLNVGLGELAEAMAAQSASEESQEPGQLIPDNTPMPRVEPKGAASRRN